MNQVLVDRDVFFDLIILIFFVSLIDSLQVLVDGELFLLVVAKIYTLTNKNEHKLFADCDVHFVFDRMQVVHVRMYADGASCAR